MAVQLKEMSRRFVSWLLEVVKDHGTSQGAAWSHWYPQQQVLGSPSVLLVPALDQPGNVVVCHLWAETWQTMTENGTRWIYFLLWRFLYAAITQILLSAILPCEMGIIAIQSGKKLKLMKVLI